MIPKPKEIGTIHFIGIGGIGMSGIAEVLHNLGYAVQGSDVRLSQRVEELRSIGVPVEIGHDSANLVRRAPSWSRPPFPREMWKSWRPGKRGFRS